MIESRSALSSEPSEASERDSDEMHRPLLDLQVESKIMGRVLSGIIAGALIAWALIATNHGWWAAAIPVFIVAGGAGLVSELKADRIRIFKDGILASRINTYGDKNPFWIKLPWSVILHLDLTDRSLQIASTLDFSTHGRVFSYLEEISREEKAKLINDLKSLQQRGDIPCMVRIIE